MTQTEQLQSNLKAPGETGIETIIDPLPRIPLVSVTDIRKHFGGVQALKGVDLDICAGEVHGLVGANGAGKSTLIRILAGVEQPDRGIIRVNGQEVIIPNPQASTELGLSFIHQELNLVPKFNAMENMTLGLPKPSRLGLIDWPSVRRRVEEVAERINIDFPLSVPVDELSVADQWLISIGRALIWESKLIAMDEPTASLSEAEAQTLFNVIRELASEGIGILYVSHRLEEILMLCDSVTVFRDGNMVQRLKREEMTRRLLVEGIVGGKVKTNGNPISHYDKSDHPVVLTVEGLSRGKIVNSASFNLHEGEILGLAGLVGAGRTELVRMIFAAERRRTGSMQLSGKPYNPKSPADAVAHGVAMVPEERRSEGLVLDKSVNFNLNIPHLRPLRKWPRLPFVSPSQGAQTAIEIVRKLEIKTPHAETPVADLSGGNQQKVVIGKWLGRRPKVLILDEPSRGVDVGARGEIHQIIHDMAEENTSFIIISSENEELPGLCDRVLVMVEGNIAGELVGEDITKEAILHLSYSHDLHEVEEQEDGDRNTD
ncbi:MAG: sugar ABC transporter ATP-binding protein [Chloroflexota bacterium]|jgi:ABC-type sugar transport system ATPase subunit